MPEPEPEPAVAGEPGWYRAVGLALLTACGLLSGVLELLFIPLYAGSVVVPVAVLAAVVGNVLLPRLAHQLGVATRLAALPFLGWLLVMLVAVLLPRPEGDVVVPGGSLTWVTYGVLLGGAVAGTLTLVIQSAPPITTSTPPDPPSPSPRPASRPRPKR